MSPSYLNRHGVRYYLPEFGPPVRWLASVPVWDSTDFDFPALLYYECDADNLSMRSIEIWSDGRVMLAFPGGPDGDRLPEGPLPSVEECKARLTGSSREITELEFNALWAALSRLPLGEAASEEAPPIYLDTSPRA